MLARVGGEEFLLVLPDADIEQAASVVSKLRESTPLARKFSSGLCQWDGEALPEELLSAADTAMYAAKRAGGDRCERASHSALTGFSPSTDDAPDAVLRVPIPLGIRVWRPVRRQLTEFAPARPGSKRGPSAS
jgi:hypothetical protein